MRRFVLIGIIIAILLIGVVAYFFFFDPESRVITPSPNGNVIDNSKGQQQGAMAISARPVISAALSLDQTSVWYFGKDGQLYRNSLSGADELNFNLPGADPAIKSVLWPSTGNDFIVWAKAIEGSGSFWTYSAERSGFTTLSAGVKEVAWLPDGRHIVYVWEKGDGGYELKTSESSGVNYLTIMPLDGFYKLRVAPSGQFALLLEPPREAAVNSAYAVDLVSGEKIKILDRGRNLGVLISPDSKKMLFTRASSETSLPELWLYDFTSDGFKNLNLITALSKVVWSPGSEAFYFAQPGSLPAGDAEIAAPTTDKLFRFDIQTLEKSAVELNQDGKDFDVRDPIVDNSGFLMFFRDGKDGKLYRINLK